MNDIRPDIEQIYQESKSSQRPLAALREALIYYIEAKTGDSMDKDMLEFAADYHDINSQAHKKGYDSYIGDLVNLVERYMHTFNQRKKIEQMEQRRKEQERAQRSLF